MDNSSWILQMLKALLIWVYNLFLPKFIVKLIKLERHHSSSGYYSSLAIKLSISKFINTAGTPLWLYIFKKNGWIENRGDA